MILHALPSCKTSLTELEKKSCFGLSDQSISFTGLISTSNTGSDAGMMTALSLSSLCLAETFAAADLDCNSIECVLPKTALLEVDNVNQHSGRKSGTSRSTKAPILT